MSDRATRHEKFEMEREISLLREEIERLKKAAEPPPKKIQGPPVFHPVTNRNPTKEEMTAAVLKVTEDKKSIQAVAEETGIGKDRIRNGITRIGKGENILGQPGRHSVWTKEMQNRLIIRMKQRDMRGDSTRHSPIHGNRSTIDVGSRKPEETPGTFANLVYEILLEVRQETLNRPLLPSERKMVCDNTLRNIEKEVAIVINANSPTSVQSERRYQALDDPYNYVSLACQALIIFGDKYDDSLIFNYDSSSHFLNEYIQTKLTVGKEGLKELNRRHRNPTYTAELEKRRGISYGACTSAAKGLGAFVIFLRDECFNKFPHTGMMSLTSK